jgi:hypothetical protein
MEHHAKFHTERWSQAVVITTQGYLGSHRSFPSGGPTPSTYRKNGLAKPHSYPTPLLVFIFLIQELPSRRTIPPPFYPPGIPSPLQPPRMRP